MNEEVLYNKHGLSYVRSTRHGMGIGFGGHCNSGGFVRFVSCHKREAHPPCLIPCDELQHGWWRLPEVIVFIRFVRYIHLQESSYSTFYLTNVLYMPGSTLIGCTLTYREGTSGAQIWALCSGRLHMHIVGVLFHCLSLSTFFRSLLLLL